MDKFENILVTTVMCSAMYLSSYGASISGFINGVDSHSESILSVFKFIQIRVDGAYELELFWLVYGPQSLRARKVIICIFK